MADVKWIKITTDIFDDEKISLIESLPDAYAIIVAWFKLLCLAGKMNNSGVFMLNNQIPYTDKMLATIFRMKESTVQLALQTFEQFGMVEIIDGVITIPNWGKHQNLDQLESKREYMRTYMQEYREKQRALTAGKTNSKTNSKANVSQAEKEEEGEREEDKDIHSFIRAENSFVKNDDLSEIVDNSVDNSRRAYLSGELGRGRVLLSEEQLDDLLKKLSIDEFDKYVNIVADQEEKGRRYKKKTHYAAILDMAMKDRRIK